MLSRKVKKEAVFGCGEMERPSRVEDIGLDIQARGRTKMILADGWWELDSDAEAISPESWLTIMYATEPVILVSQTYIREHK
ncbi:hypothetical protein ACFX13_002661 [Malus domestica]